MWIRLTLLIAAITLLSCNREVESEKPNILFIFADDQSYHTIRELGNQEVITPTLDELARQGTAFTTAYNMGGWHGAICVASRTMFNTGRFLWRAEAVDSKNALDSLAVRGELWSKEMESPCRLNMASSVCPRLTFTASQLISPPERLAVASFSAAAAPGSGFLSGRGRSMISGRVTGSGSSPDSKIPSRIPTRISVAPKTITFRRVSQCFSS